MDDSSTSTTPEQSPVALDLDALSPKAAEINYKGKTISVRALDLPDYSKLIELYNNLSTVNVEENDPGKVMPIYEKIREVINDIIPELKEEPLTLAQLLAVFNLLVEANSPQDKALAELAKRGIEVKGGEGDSSPKGLTSSEPLPSSSEVTPPTE